ncbi:unnamed protein product [Phaedon cochleariae]|uniref:Regucalcin n=1 Tax=Phaedon cochleariae TaxID=80249 RepID=A0A9N9X218_PHACE|nr:unnamed protein product [Phaedon cochleariae]
MFFRAFLYLTWLLATAISTHFDGPSITQVTAPVDHAEGPHWDGRHNILYYVDIHSGGVLAYHYNTNTLSRMHLNGDVTPVIPSRKDPHLLLVGLNRSVVAVEWDAKQKVGSQAVLTTVSEQFPLSRFNDGKADKRGRLWWGTMGVETNLVVPPGQGFFYEITREHIENPIIIRKDVSISNGLAWNKANNKLYYIDTPTLKVVEFDYDDEKGTISSENRTVFDVNEHPSIAGAPDGMTIDEDDNLYICLYGGGAVIKVNSSTGKLLQVIALPARDVTSAAFGGPKLDILFVTTSRVSLTPKERLQLPAAGSVFAIERLGARGLPAFTADIVDSVPKKPVNLLENIFGPEIFTPGNGNKNVVTRNTSEPGGSK